MITLTELHKIAALAKLSLDGADTDALLRDIGGIIDFADAVSRANLGGADLSETDDTYPLREDIAGKSVANADIIANAGETRGGFFVARRIGGAR
ncbi:MAG: hypothetical protein LBN02_10190 [Oscillospiraceae bacterium]|jgi:aspartyl/glutamyl-tRNA(Asn/Gln) amidotransferase C subunit|nr:hypothetical protein [Oscillospiraceae bacterium]